MSGSELAENHNRAARQRAREERVTGPEISVTSGIAGESVVVLVEGASFAISAPHGDIEPGRAQGLFVADTRFVSTWRLLIDDSPTQGLTAIVRRPFAGTFLARARRGVDSPLLITRERLVGSGMREDLLLQNLGAEPAACSVVFEVDADFADIFAVKEDRVVARGERTVELAGQQMIFSFTYRTTQRRLFINADERATVTPHFVIFDVLVPAKGEWRTRLECHVELDGRPRELRHHSKEPIDGSASATRLETWAEALPRVETDDPDLNAAIARSGSDLGALRIFDPAHPGDVAIAAGAPWFMTLFGRDSLITSWMTLAVDPGIAAGTLRTLARLQGDKIDPLSEEQPGRILHELRWGMLSSPELRIGARYYGSVDATPLFVLLLGALHRFGGADDVVTDLLPNADRALAWIDEFGDRDGDGFVEYARATDRGLRNQGWKDSGDGINFRDARLAEPPIALCEVQGYVYAALCARAEIARDRGDISTARRCEGRAAALKAAFNDAFWIEAEGYFAIGLDREKRQIDSLTSNIGHCLWTGIVEERRAPPLAERLMSPEMFSGWGIRTLSAEMGAYNPVSYHNGSVWPHDSAICADGLMRYGFVAEAQRVALALLDATTFFAGRLPELFCGFARDDYPSVVPYPNACAPQAWATATPFSLLRTLVHLDPQIPEHVVRLSPAVPEVLGTLRLENIPLAGVRVALEAEGEKGRIEGLPAGVSARYAPRPPTRTS